MGPRRTPCAALDARRGRAPKPVRSSCPVGSRTLVFPIDGRLLLDGLPFHHAGFDVTVRQLDNARITVIATVPAIITEYAPMRAVLALAERAAASDAAVLISGELGTGKGLLARALHQWSTRSAAPLAELRCTSTPARAIEHELFGEGDARGGGLLARASGGTVVLHEVGALDRHAQSSLLRVLTRGEAGARHDARSDGRRAEPAVRIIASTSDDLAQRAASGRFDPDLLGRLSTVRIALPPLRERAVDIRPLAEHFLRADTGRLPRTVSDEAIEVLEAYRWPGNVRELRHVVERATMLTRDGVIRAADLPFDLRPGVGSIASAGDGLVSLDEMERHHIQMVLEHVEWHQGRAAGILGISPKTLYRKMRSYGFRRPVPLGRRPEPEHMA